MDKQILEIAKKIVEENKVTMYYEIFGAEEMEDLIDSTVLSVENTEVIDAYGEEAEGIEIRFKKKNEDKVAIQFAADRGGISRADIKEDIVKLAKAYIELCEEEDYPDIRELIDMNIEDDEDDEEFEW